MFSEVPHLASAPSGQARLHVAGAAAALWHQKLLLGCVCGGVNRQKGFVREERSSFLSPPETPSWA